MILGENLRPDHTYREGLARGELMYQRCATCDRAIFYPRLACPHCGSPDVHFRVSSRTGTVYSYTAITERNAPSYLVCLIDLDDGFRMMSTVVGGPAEDVEVGMRVRGRVEAVDGEEAHRVVFVAAEQS